MPRALEPPNKRMQAQRGETQDTLEKTRTPIPRLAARMSTGPYPYNSFRPDQPNLTSWPRPPTPPPNPVTAQLRCRHLWPQTQPDQSPTHRASPKPRPDPHATEPHPSPPADLAPQPALLETASKSKPVTYAEACGAKSIAPPKCSSVKATTLQPY